VQRMLVSASMICLVLGILGMVHPETFSVLGVPIVPQPALPAAVVGLVLGTIAGRGARVAGLAVPLVLLSLVAFPEAPALLARMASERHPMRSVRDGVVEVRREERSAGRPVRDELVYLPSGFFHPLFFYFRTFGWDPQTRGLTDDQLAAIVERPGEQRPVLITKANFESVRWGSRSLPIPKPSYAELSSVVVMVLPGPYARCAQ
jgi:hypothetical protein